MRRKKRLYGEIDLLQVRVQEGHELRFSAKFPKLVAYNSFELKRNTGPRVVSNFGK